MYLKEATAAKEEDKSTSWRRYSGEVRSVAEADWVPGKLLQSPALFISEEADMAVRNSSQRDYLLNTNITQGEELVYEVEDNDVPGLSPTSVTMQLTYFETSMTASARSEEEAMEAVALEMLKEAGPWVEDSVYDSVNDGITASLPEAYNDWAPPK